MQTPTSQHPELNTSAIPSESTGTPRLLQLPQEIRDQIYAYLFVPGVIAIECAVTKAPKSRAAVGGETGFCEALYQKYKLRHPLVYRRTWEVPVHDLAVPADEFQLDSSTVHMTYQRAAPRKLEDRETPELKLLQVCKQLHAEVSEGFYSKWAFEFTSDFSVPAAAAFLEDRTTHARGLIRTFELRVQESLSGGSTNQNMVAELTNSYDCFPKLCALLASGAKLRKLSLIIQSRACYLDRYPWRLPNIEQLVNGDHEERRPRLGQRRVLPAEQIIACFPKPRPDWGWRGVLPAERATSWMQPLLEITGLDALSVFWILTSPTVQSELATVLQMRQHMLAGGAKSKDELGFTHRVLRETSIEEGMWLISGSDVWFHPESGQLRWKDYSPSRRHYTPEQLDARDIERDADGDHPLVRDIMQEGKHHAIKICRFELSATGCSFLGSRRSSIPRFLFASDNSLLR